MLAKFREMKEQWCVCENNVGIPVDEKYGNSAI